MSGPVHYVDIGLRIKFDLQKRRHLMEVAHTLLKEHVGVPVNDDPEDEAVRPMTDEEEVSDEISDMSDCIAEILFAHPLLEELGLEIIASHATEATAAGSFEELPDLNVASSTRVRPIANATTSELDDDLEGELDEVNDSGVFLCRWPNGEFSVVAAVTKRQAIIDLDELGAAEPEMVQPIDTCMLDFGLDSKGNIELLQMGEETSELFYSKCYPLLDAFKASEESSPLFDAGASKEAKRAAQQRLRKVISKERTRLWVGQPRREASTKLGKDIQKKMGASSIVADRYAEHVATIVLESFEPPDDEKPQ